jgi:hypothetical protein
LPWILWVRIVAGEEEATQCASSDWFQKLSYSWILAIKQ